MTDNRKGKDNIQYVGNILNTNTVVPASAVISNMTNENIEDYIFNCLLPAHGVDTTGMTLLLMSDFVLYLTTNVLIPILIIDSDNKEILKKGVQNNNIQFVIDISNTGKVKITDKLKNALASIVNEKIPYQELKQKGEKYIFITLDMEEILKDMLAADGHHFAVGYSNVKKVKGENGRKSIISFRATKFIATRKNKKKEMSLSDKGATKVAEHIANMMKRNNR